MSEVNHSKEYSAGFLKVGHGWAKLGKFSTLLFFSFFLYFCWKRDLSEILSKSLSQNFVKI